MELERAVEAYARHVALAGIVLSQVDMRRQSRFGYGDESFYYAKYKSYYA